MRLELTSDTVATCPQCIGTARYFFNLIFVGAGGVASVFAEARLAGKKSPAKWRG
jgi:hypothetical protein